MPQGAQLTQNKFPPVMPTKPVKWVFWTVLLLSLWHNAFLFKWELCWNTATEALSVALHVHSHILNQIKAFTFWCKTHLVPSLSKHTFCWTFLQPVYDYRDRWLLCSGGSSMAVTSQSCTGASQGTRGGDTATWTMKHYCLPEGKIFERWNVMKNSVELLNGEPPKIYQRIEKHLHADSDTHIYLNKQYFHPNQIFVKLKYLKIPSGMF